ncbi:epoxide hydrolase [Fusarium oxysporum f. sp. phaseoli]
MRPFKLGIAFMLTNTYHYLRARPAGIPKGTILLLHGFPDFSYGWRYQVPVLASLGYQVIIPDMLGYADTSSPPDLSNWAEKQLSIDMAELLGQLVPGEQVIVGGHDWGAGLTYKFAIWYPELVKAFFTVAIPYIPPWLGLSKQWIDLPVLIGRYNFTTLGYQLQFINPSIDRNFTTPNQVHMLLNTFFGGLTPDGQSAFNFYQGLLYGLMPMLKPNPLVNATDMDFYVQKLLQHGMRGLFNWYRTREMDWEDDLQIAQAGNFEYGMPALFIPTLKDDFLLPQYYENMGQYFKSLTIESLDTGHWDLWEGREMVNKILERWIISLEH